MTCSRRVAVRSEFEGSGRASGACGRGLHRARTSPPLERPAERCGPRAGAASRPIRAEARRRALNRLYRVKELNIKQVKGKVDGNNSTDRSHGRAVCAPA